MYHVLVNVVFVFRQEAQLTVLARVFILLDMICKIILTIKYFLTRFTLNKMLMVYIGMAAHNIRYRRSITVKLWDI